MSNYYVEPDKEKIYNEVIPSNIFESHIIAGDMNKSQTDIQKIYNIYHIKNISNEIKKLDVEYKLSGHPIVIFKKTLKVALINE